MTDSQDLSLLRAHIGAVRRRRVDGVVRELSWQAEIGVGPDGAGPAGLATLEPAGSGLRAYFDYAAPDRLLGLTVPCGVAPVGGGDVPQGGPLSEIDAAVLDVLLGPDARRSLEAGLGGEASAYIEPRLGVWTRAGRLATMQTLLRDHAQPLDGLWASEAAVLVSRLGHGAPLASWAGSLAEAAASAIRLLPANVDEDALPSNLFGVLLGCVEIAPDVDFGPAIKEWRARAADRRLAEARDLIESLAPQYEEVEAAAFRSSSGVEDTAAELFRSGRVFRGERKWPDDRYQQAAIDHSVASSAGRAAWQVDDGRLRVVVALSDRHPWPNSWAGRVMVRATDASTGALVAASLSMQRVGDDQLEADLTLPVSVEPTNLFVCVGRHLPVAPLTPEQFSLRQANAEERSRLDGVRRRFVAETVGELVGPQDLVNQVARSPEPGPRTGARSLSWGAGRPVQAGDFELQRLQIENGDPELSLEQSDRLIEACAEGRSYSTADALDRYAADAYYDLIA